MSLTSYHLLYPATIMLYYNIVPKNICQLKFTQVKNFLYTEYFSLLREVELLQLSGISKEISLFRGVFADSEIIIDKGAFSGV